jgi:hypothetical protein
MPSGSTSTTLSNSSPFDVAGLSTEIGRVSDAVPGATCPGNSGSRPATSKGLEFDSVVLVDPEGVRTGAARGAASLYVAMTRPTQRLTVVG